MCDYAHTAVPNVCVKRSPGSHLVRMPSQHGLSVCFSQTFNPGAAPLAPVVTCAECCCFVVHCYCCNDTCTLISTSGQLHACTRANTCNECNEKMCRQIIVDLCPLDTRSSCSWLKHGISYSPPAIPNMPGLCAEFQLVANDKWLHVTKAPCD